MLSMYLNALVNLTQKKNFKFVVHKDDFLTEKRCDELIKMFDNSEQYKATVAGTYSGNGADVVNENVRKVQEVRFSEKILVPDGRWSKIEAVSSKNNPR